MEEHEIDRIRKQHLRRASSILVRGTTGYETVSSIALDTLCSVGVQYMQNMFAQAHSYAEHATRAWPNMNDVVRTLEERNISAADLETYYHLDMVARANPQIASSVHDLCNRSSLTSSATVDENANAKAESMLRRLVFSHQHPGTAMAIDNEEEDEDEDAAFEAPNTELLRGNSLEPVAVASAAADIPVALLMQKETTTGNQVEDFERRRMAETMVLLPEPILPEHIPEHLPNFPCPHTYKMSPVFPKREQDFFHTRVHKAEQSRQAEENLHRLISGPQLSSTTNDNNGTDSSDSLDQQELSTTKTSKGARKRIQQLFPPAHFRDMGKRSRLASTALM